jgi:phenylacetate-coenzyme A ligase PaaK-like adenylate-forming protein
MNVRKPIIYILLYAGGSMIPKRLKEIRQWEQAGRHEIAEWSQAKLEKLLAHAYQNVPYYRKVLEESEVVVGGTVQLEHFSRMPVLTKSIIRREWNNLHSQDYQARKPYENTSGGSTGEPVRFIQDKEYSDWNIANKIYYKRFAGQEIGEKELRLWGSERDLLEGKEKFSIRLRNWLYNRMELNAFKISPEDMFRFVEVINRVRPTWIESYVQAITDFSRFIRENDLHIYPPKGVLTSAGTLYPEMRQTIEEAFGCTVFNRYGGREAGDMACSCEKQEGLHVSVWNSHLEILNDHLAPAGPSETGRIYVTTLNNYSMPLIRYDIGDMAVAGANQVCSCGRSTPTLEKVAGRHMEAFRTREGKIVPAEFFIHFVGVVFNQGYIGKFQVVQEDYDDILIRVVVRDQANFERHSGQIVESIQTVMGPDCRIRFEPVEDIETSASGKYLYTLSKVS